MYAYAPCLIRMHGSDTGSLLCVKMPGRVKKPG